MTTIPLQSGNTQLSYALEVTDPIIADGGIAMTLAVSNPTGDTITLQSVALAFPEGTNATDLIAGGTAIATQPPSGWDAGSDGGTVTFTAPGGGVAVSGGELTFTLQTTANASPGSVNVLLTETAADPPGGFQQGTGTFPLTKFPVGFSLSDLTTVTAAGLDVDYGEPALLTWVATGDGVSCTLDYQPAESGSPVSAPVPNIAPTAGFASEGLTRSGNVTFTLCAQVSVLGQDNPLTASRQCTVSVESMEYQLLAQPVRVGVNGLVWLQWNAQNADHCLFEDGTVLPAVGSRYYVLAETQTFSVTAVGPDGQKDEKQVTVEVDPSIVPTPELGANLDASYVYTAPAGGPGEGGHTGYRIFGPERPPIPVPIPGATGDPGHDADTPAWELYPLDTSGGTDRVIGVTVTGGAGGQGGAANGIAPGNGGNGGNVSLNCIWDPGRGAPCQYIINLIPGAGGPGGDGGGSPGGPGTSVSATIAGQPVYFL